jgi:hypothetical protein
MGADWLMDQAEVVTRSVSNKKPRAPWSGFWYVNVDDCKERSWEDCRRFGFLAAGGGRIYSDQLQRLDIGDQVFAYQKKAGYVGYGIVTQKVRPASEFRCDGKLLSECVQSSPDLLLHKNDPDLEEYAIGIDWKKTFTIQDAKKSSGMFANQNVVCKLSDPETLEFLKRAFELS